MSQGWGSSHWERNAVPVPSTHRQAYLQTDSTNPQKERRSFFPQPCPIVTLNFFKLLLLSIQQYGGATGVERERRQAHHKLGRGQAEVILHWSAQVSSNLDDLFN